MDNLDVIIVGGGISGLAALHWLSKGGARVLLLERRVAPGGVIGSRRTPQGALVELGPNSMQYNTPYLHQLVADLGLEESVMRPGPEAANRYIMRDGRLVPAPLGPKSLLRSELFSRAAKLRLAREPFIAAGSGEREESVAQFVERRLGREVLDYAVNPFISGIYAGRPERLSFRHSFPRLFELEQGSGSLMRGGITSARKKRKERKREGAPAFEKGLFSFTEGMGMLPAAIESRWLDRIRPGVSAERIEPASNGWRVIAASGESFQARHLIVATEAYTAAGLVARHDPHLSSVLESIEYPPIAVAALLYDRASIAHPLDGFGLLLPEVEKRNILGVLFSSTLFPNRAPEGTALLTVFIGGARQPELALRGREEIEFEVHSELRRALGISARPRAFDLHLWPRSIPQYNLGYGQILSAIDSAEVRSPGLHFLGNYRGGVSVGDCVRNGAELAARLLQGVHHAIPEDKDESPWTVAEKDTVVEEDTIVEEDTVAEENTIAEENVELRMQDEERRGE